MRRMSSKYSSLTMHFVFGTRNRKPVLYEQREKVGHAEEVTGGR